MYFRDQNIFSSTECYPQRQRESNPAYMKESSWKEKQKGRDRLPKKNVLDLVSLGCSLSLNCRQHTHKYAPSKIQDR